jgi:hypothetical protein
MASRWDGARVVAGSRLTDTKYMETTEVIGSRLIEGGFSTRDAVVLFSTVYTFTVSFAVEEQAVSPIQGQRSLVRRRTARGSLVEDKSAQMYSAFGWRFIRPV